MSIRGFAPFVIALIGVNTGSGFIIIPVPAIGDVIDNPMPIVGEVPDVPDAQLHIGIVPGSLDDAMVKRPEEHFREKGQYVDAHLFAPFYRSPGMILMIILRLSKSISRTNSRAAGTRNSRAVSACLMMKQSLTPVNK